ncbi:nucleolar protein dao-5-like [Lolium rigidum]|uniref:nucleolar protein dao-5-like n=1 Tax=Lolium rigidum TaxID=89674 RepID=UPI001F5D9F31|nr:nucleolar protein dao-5-like [Lolium rigidum]
MARKRRASPSPPPPAPTPPREEPSSSEEEEEEAAPATQKAPQNPKPASTAASDADSSDGDEEEESSDPEIGAEAYQLRQAARSPGKPSAAASKPRSGADEEEAARKPKAEAGKKKKRQAAEYPPSGKAKKAKTDVEEKAAPEPALLGKAKKKARPEKELNPSSSKGKKHKALAELDVPDHSLSSKSRQRWTTADEIKVLEALASHIKTNGTQPSADDLIAAVGDSLERKNCSKSDVYEKVRKLKRRHEAAAKKVASTGTLPGNDDELRKFNLSEAVWGERANKVAALPVSQNDGTSSKSKKGRTNKEKADGHLKPGGTAKETGSAVNENVGALPGSSKGQATKEKVDGDIKGSLSEKATTADTPVKSKKRGNHKEELKDHAKAGTTKETTSSAATQNGSTSVRSKSDNKEKRNRDAESLRPKEATAVTQNGGTLAQLKNGETHEEKMDADPNVKSMRKGFEELQNLYPNLTSYVESIQAQHPCGETLKRAFGFIAEDKACALESKIKKQRVAEMKMENRRADTKKEVTNMLIRLLD